MGAIRRKGDEVIDDFLDKSNCFLTTERCGASWICAYISEVHRQLFKKPIYWDYEISRIIAIDPKYDLPKTHCSVYYVRLEWLVKRGWDKIIVLERPFESWRDAVFRYFKPKLTKGKIHKKYPDWEERLRNYHDLVHGDKTEYPNVLRVNLSDINNYTVDQTNEILNFLEYPLETHEEIDDKIYIRQRPPVFPTRIEGRDWDIQGTIINKGHNFDPYQLDMIEMGIKGLLPLIEKDLVEHPDANQDGYKKGKGQYINYEYPNPYKLSPEECKYQKAQVFRVKPNGMPDILKIKGWI